MSSRSQPDLACANTWNDQYSQGRWDYLEELPEQHRYAVIANYINFSSGPTGSRILDAGSGTGILLNHLSKPVIKRYVGIDISDIALSHIRYKLSGYEPVCTSIESYSTVPGELFDMIVFSEVLYCLDTPKQELERYPTFLAPNGLVVVSMWRPNDPEDQWAGRINNVWQIIANANWIELDHTVMANRTSLRTWDLRLFRPYVHTHKRENQERDE